MSVAPVAPVQVTMYFVAEVGETEIFPEIAPPVEKLVPAHEKASVEDQVSFEMSPMLTVPGVAVSVATGGAQLESGGVEGVAALQEPSHWMVPEVVFV
jgi:hypothetical protein